MHSSWLTRFINLKHHTKDTLPWSRLIPILERAACKTNSTEKKRRTTNCSDTPLKQNLACWIIWKLMPMPILQRLFIRASSLRNRTSPVPSWRTLRQRCKHWLLRRVLFSIGTVFKITGSRVSAGGQSKHQQAHNRWRRPTHTHRFGRGHLLPLLLCRAAGCRILLRLFWTYRRYFLTAWPASLACNFVEYWRGFLA